MSLLLLSQPADMTKYGIMYGGVQKNIGPAGMVISIIREDLITGDVLPGTPTMLNFKTHADARLHVQHTQLLRAFICAARSLNGCKAMGGLEAMQENNQRKAGILYDFLDQSHLFKGTVVKEDRSLMNVPFVTGKSGSGC